MPRTASTKKKTATKRRPASPARKVSSPRPIAASHDRLKGSRSPVNVLAKLLHFQMLAKLHHFQTRSYAMHKNTDVLYADLVLLIDALFEHFQGAIQDLPSTAKLSIPAVPTITDAQMVKEAKKMLAYLKKDAIADLGAKGDSGIQASVDDVYNRIAQFIYLLQFQ